MVIGSRRRHRRRLYKIARPMLLPTSLKPAYVCKVPCQHYKLRLGVRVLGLLSS